MSLKRRRRKKKKAAHHEIVSSSSVSRPSFLFPLFFFFFFFYFLASFTTRSRNWGEEVQSLTSEWRCCDRIDGGHQTIQPLFTMDITRKYIAHLWQTAPMCIQIHRAIKTFPSSTLYEREHTHTHTKKGGRESGKAAGGGGRSYWWWPFFSRVTTRLYGHCRMRLIAAVRLLFEKYDSAPPSPQVYSLERTWGYGEGK